MSIIAPAFEQQAGEPVGDWHPARFTASLTGSENFRSDGDRLLNFADRYWSVSTSSRFSLDDWQKWLIRHILERYPDDWPVERLRGQLRFRQVVISMGRQNGKSLIAAILVIYLLVLHKRGPRVVGLASIARQAKIVYDRVKYAVENSGALSSSLKTTATRGITHKNGAGVYQILPADEDSAQGEPITGAIYDELHLGLMALWDALVLGQRAQESSVLIGITTAGDDDSELLIRLYAEGEAAIEGDDERFGFFCWEGANDELTEANVIAANPAVACGRIPLDTTMSEARKMWLRPRDKKTGMTGRERVIRYTLNRFVSGSSAAWASTSAWGDTSAVIEQLEGDLVFGIDRTDSWEHAGIVAVAMTETGPIVEPVAALNDASPELLADLCRELASVHRATFAMPADLLGPLADQLRDEGYEVWKLAATEDATAAQTTQAAIARRAIIHAADPLMRVQMGHGRRRNLAEGWRLSRTLSTGPIDLIKAMTVGVYVATMQRDRGPQIW